MATIGFVIDYWGRLQTFIFAMISPAMFHDHWLTGFGWVGLTAVTWFGSRGLRLLLAGDRIDPVTQLELAWW
jgi:hypothetical protein